MEKRIHVPWMYLDEWKKVYEYIYSKDIELQKRGYERLLLWKVRQNQLPSGIECTLELIHIHTIDQEITEQISKGEKTVYAEHDLQLMYSAAITRYLNHVSNVVQTQKDTMFDMAKSLNIPNWLVVLRHDGAHKTSLPSLSVLRMGVNFALEWLHENYWKPSATIPSLEFSKTESRFSNKRVGKILEIWQSLQLYKINGYSTMLEIPDDNLRLSAAKFIKQSFQEDSENSMWVKKKRSLSHIIELFRKKLLLALKGGTRNENLIAMLLESETFIPPANFISKKNKELTQTEILAWISRFWKNLIASLQENFGLFPVLVHKLLIQLNEEESKHRQCVMALWIKQLCISMLKSQIVLKEAYKTSSNIIKDDIDIRMMKKETLKPKITVNPKVLKKVEEKFSHLRDGYFVLQNDEKANSCPLSDLEIAVLNPNEFTSIFLTSLMDVARPPVEKKRKLLLEELVSIAVKTTGLDSVTADGPVRTIKDFSHKKEGEELELDIQTTNHVDQDVEFDSEYSWATCPLGILPWQRGSAVMLDIPSEVRWELSENLAPNVPTLDVSLISTVQKKVNWPGVMKNISKVRAIVKKKKMKYRKIRKASRHIAAGL